MLEQRLDKENESVDSNSSSHPFITNTNNPNYNPSPNQPQSKYLYFVVAAIIGTEFCERLCYYGIQGSLNLFLQNQMDQSKATASFNVAMFGGVCYLTPLLGGYFADTYLGRYYAILLFVTFYLIGIIGVAIVAWILSTDHSDDPLQSESIPFWISLYLIALGTGGIKPNVSTLGAEQFETDEPKFSLKQHRSNTELTSELMPVSYTANDDSLMKEIANNHNNFSLQTNPNTYSLPNIDQDEEEQPDAIMTMDTRANNGGTDSAENVLSSLIINETESNNLLLKQKKQKESFFNWFYFSINLGSFFSYTIIAYLCQNINFGIGYTVPSVALIIGIIIFIIASKFYRIVPPQGSILSNVVKIIFYGMTHGMSLDNAKIKYGNDEVESVKSIVKLLPFLFFNIIYWCVYAQQSTLFYAQGCQMDIRINNNIKVPIATLGLFDVIPILILVPLFDRCLIPCLRKRGYKVTMLQRMGTGFIFAALSVICAGILEVWRKESDLTDVESACNDGGDGEKIYVSDISIFYQIPQFVLIGTSEVLASVTGLEFFFSQAPPEMRSILQSLNLVTTGLGTWLVGLFIMLVNINKNNLWITDNLDNGHLDLYFFMIGGLVLIAFFAFLWAAIRYKYNSFEKDMLVIDTNKPNVDAMFDNVLETTPKVDRDDIMNKRNIFNYMTPPQDIRDDARVSYANQ